MSVALFIIMLSVEALLNVFCHYLCFSVTLAEVSAPKVEEKIFQTNGQSYKKVCGRILRSN